MNNNVVLVKDDNNIEKILFGNGIGFNKQPGDYVNTNLIQRLFIPNDSIEKFRIFNPEILATAASIIEYGEKSLKTFFGAGLLYALTDHLTFSLKRMEENSNPIKWEIPYLYSSEYLVGKQAILIVKDELNIELLEEEAAFIALHFVNAQIDNADMIQTLKLTELLKKIVEIIESVFNSNLRKDSEEYSRFITHIRYFANRQHNNKIVPAIDNDITEFVKRNYIKSYACGLLIQEMLHTDYGWEVNENELIYLVIHIERILKTIG